MIVALSRDQIRALDACAADQCNVAGIVLMENAGRGAAEVVERLLERRALHGRGRVLVLCGPGNNGGDGFVVARRLVVRGHDVRVVLTANADRLKGDALANYKAWTGLGGAVADIHSDAELARLDGELDGAAVVVDALLGTGLDRDVEGRLRTIIERINAADVLRVALDIPSGLHADTGRVLGVAVRAHATVTFAHLKLGLLASTGAEHAGHVEVADIGVPPSLHERVGHAATVVEPADVARAIAPRPLATHKGSAGRVIAVAGSAGKTGAALLVARGALRSGAGLVSICTSPEAADSLDRRVLEEMTLRVDPARLEASLDEHLAGAAAVAVGPGIGLDEHARKVVDHVVLGWDGVKVVDADALTHFGGRAGELAKAAGHLILTPHPGEMGRLLGSSGTEVEADRFGALRRAVELTRAVVLLKGARTLIGAPGELPIVNSSGTPALATAGAGDVLSGITLALACSLTPHQAAWCAAWVHGCAAEAWAAEAGADRGLLAHEVADRVPGVLAGLASAVRPLPL